MSFFKKKSGKQQSPKQQQQPGGGASKPHLGKGVVRDIFGTLPNGATVDRFTFRNRRGMEVQLITLGCTITSIKVPDGEGRFEDVVLGFDDLEGYQRQDNPYFGALVGRVANRINRGIFQIDGSIYYLPTNEGQNHLHGGFYGWDKVMWQAHQEVDRVTFSHVSPDGDEDYPGDVRVNVTFSLSDENELIIRYTAEVNGKPTPINPTMQPYFNLAREGADSVWDHIVTINSDKYCPSGKDFIPTGDISDVTDTIYDFRKGVRVGDRLPNTSSVTPFDLAPEFDGYDTFFCLGGPTGKKLAARVSLTESGRWLEVYTDQPGIRLYTGNKLHILGGKQGNYYGKHSGLCLQPQGYPDAVNHANFPDMILRPGSVYIQTTWFKFGTLASVHGY